MKKLAMAVAAIMMVLCLSACDYQPAEGPSFSLDVVNNCQSDIYGLHYEYYLDGQPIGGAIVRVANTAMIPLPSGNTTVLTFTPADFPTGADLSTFQLELFVVMEDNIEIAVSPLLELAAQYGQQYQFTLSGSNADGFAISYQ